MRTEQPLSVHARNPHFETPQDPALADARRTHRDLSRPTRRSAGDDREVALAAQQGDRPVRRSPCRRTDLTRDRSLADDTLAGLPLRGYSSAATGPAPRRRLGADRYQSRKGRRRQPDAPAEGAAAIRVVARA